MLYVSHLLKDEEMKEILAEMKTGVESIEFSVAENLDCLEDTLLAYEKRLDFMGCSRLILHGPFLDLNPMAFDREIREVTRKRYEQAYYAAKRLNAEKIVYHSCFLPKVYLLEGISERIVEFFRDFLDDKDDSVEILVENVLDPVPELLQNAALHIEHPAFGLCLDVGHANCYGEEKVMDWVEKWRPFLRHLHLHDNDGSRDSHRGIGKGTIPFRKILNNLKQDGTEKSYTLECSVYEEVLESLEFLKNSRSFF